MLITDPKKKKWMEAAIAQIMDQLRSVCDGTCQIDGDGTHGEWQKRLPIVLSTLSDDSIFNMIPGEQSVDVVEKGDEGVLIEISLP